MSKDARQWLERIHALPPGAPVKIMNVCGGHERTISQQGLRKLLPEYIELIPGPGCPVCVCPEEDIYQAIQLALHEAITLVSFGDMLRVPVNVPRGETRSLAEARSLGADVRPIASPGEAVKLARQQPEKAVIFFAAGFETTIAPVASMLAEAVPDNLFILLSGRLTWPAVDQLLRDGDSPLDALIAPGHVSAVMGGHEWRFVTEQYQKATAIAGFRAESMLAAIYSVLRQHQEQHCFLDNCYTEVVREQGNPTARQQLQQVMYVDKANWRGIGAMDNSGFHLQQDYDAHNARLQFKDYADLQRRRAGEMPPGCACADVVMGRHYPNQCPLYGRACTPASPIGPCMVSDEGACRIWWAAGKRPQATNAR